MKCPDNNMKKNGTCEWSLDSVEYNAWASACGNSWIFEVDGPNENSMKFCPFCGRQLIQLPLEDCEDISSMTPEERLAAIMAMGGTWSDFGEDSE